jgi:hypothetical protein
MNMGEAEEAGDATLGLLWRGCARERGAYQTKNTEFGQ